MCRGGFKGGGSASRHPNRSAFERCCAQLVCIRKLSARRLTRLSRSHVQDLSHFSSGASCCTAPLPPSNTPLSGHQFSLSLGADHVGSPKNRFLKPKPSAKPSAKIWPGAGQLATRRLGRAWGFSTTFLYRTNHVKIPPAGLARSWPPSPRHPPGRWSTVLGQGRWCLTARAAPAAVRVYAPGGCWLRVAAAGPVDTHVGAGRGERAGKWCAAACGVPPHCSCRDTTPRVQLLAPVGGSCQPCRWALQEDVLRAGAEWTSTVKSSRQACGPAAPRAVAPPPSVHLGAPPTLASTCCSSRNSTSYPSGTSHGFHSAPAGSIMAHGSTARVMCGKHARPGLCASEGTGSGEGTARGQGHVAAGMLLACMAFLAPELLQGSGPPRLAFL